MTDTSELCEVFRVEYEATRNIESAVAAVATAVKAQLKSRPGGANEVVVRVVVEHRRDPPKTARQEAVITKVKRLAAAEFGVEVKQMMITSRGFNRSRWHCYARWTAVGVYRAMGLSLSASAAGAGLKDHSAVIYGLKRLESHPFLQAAVARILAAVNPPAAGNAPPAQKTTPIAAQEAA